MSAVEEYAAYRRGSEWVLSSKADAAIAELRDALEETTASRYVAMRLRAEKAENAVFGLSVTLEQAEAELAALKGRRCETCNEFPHYFICKRDHNPTRWDTFSCSEWAARAEEGSGE